jgi:hypothetical protein
MNRSRRTRLARTCISKLDLLYVLLLFDSIGHVSLLYGVKMFALFIAAGLSVSVKNSLKDQIEREWIIMMYILCLIKADIHVTCVCADVN